MRIIHVHFDTAKNSVTVLPAVEVVFAGDEVVWDVSATSPSITQIKLEVKGATKFLFGGTRKAIHSQKLQGGRTQIRGVAPTVPEGELGRYEYLVRGIRGKGKRQIKLDPVIIIVPPD